MTHTNYKFMNKKDVTDEETLLHDVCRNSINWTAEKSYPGDRTKCSSLSSEGCRCVINYENRINFDTKDFEVLVRKN